MSLDTERSQEAARPQRAVGGVCLRDGRLLLIRRARGVAVGLWSLPGGRVEPGERQTEAVARELAEETSLAVTVGPVCGVAERAIDGHRFTIVNYWVQADVTTDATTDTTPDVTADTTADVTTDATADGHARPGDDADAVCWASRADLDRLKLVPRLVEFLDEHGVLDQLR